MTERHETSRSMVGIGTDRDIPGLSIDCDEPEISAPVVLP